MPVTVFLTGIFLGTENYSLMYAVNIVVVAVGIIIASHGKTAWTSAWQEDAHSFLNKP